MRKEFVIGATLFVMGFVACTQPSQPTSGANSGVEIGRTLQPTASQPTTDDYVPDIETSSKDENLDDDTLKKLKTVGKKIQHTFSSGERLRYVMRSEGDVIVGGIHGTIITNADNLPKFIKDKEGSLKKGLKTQGVGIAPWRGNPNDSKWPNKTIPYIFSGQNTASQNQKILDAINWWNDRIGVQFKPYINTSERVVFTVDPSTTCGSASSVGMSNWGPNNIYINSACLDNRALLHEMAHTAGLFHEQQRCDRDNYVYVTYPWWDLGSAVNHEKKCWSDILDYGMYDYASLMHYKYGSQPSYSWLWYSGNIANNPPSGRFYSGDWTNPAEAVGLSPITAPNVGSYRYTLSRNDILSMNTLYGDSPNFTNLGNYLSWNVGTSSYFGHVVGRVDGGGWSASVGLDSPTNWMVYGPYYLVSNLYNPKICCSAHYELMIDNITANNDPVAIIEVNSVSPGPSFTQRSLTSRIIRRGDFTAAYQYRSFELDFELTNLSPSKSLEFRVLWLGSSYVRARTITVKN